jgi:hypothetical protein
MADISHLVDFLLNEFVLDPERLRAFFDKAVEQKLIKDYALFGALAYGIQIKPITTFDADFLYDPGDNLDSGSLYRLALEMGGRTSGGKIVLNGVPFQVVPTKTVLDHEALAEAEYLEPTACKVLTPEYLIAIALQTGRHKDTARVMEAVSSDEVDHDKLERILEKYHLSMPEGR